MPEKNEPGQLNHKNAKVNKDNRWCLKKNRRLKIKEKKVKN